MAPEPEGPEAESIKRAIQEALAKHRERNIQRAELAEAVARMPDKHLDVLRSTLAGETTRGIANRLGVSTRTVERYRSKAFQALGVKTISEVAALVARSGLSIPSKPD